MDRATATYLNENKAPSRKVNEIDNRGSTFYLALFWAEELATQSADSDLAGAFGKVANNLRANAPVIAEELLSVQGKPVDLGGYYRPNPELAASVMRPSKTFNEILSMFSG